MAHHKRKRPKHQRAGCLYCKPHKDERRTPQRRLDEAERRRRVKEAFDRIFRDHEEILRRLAQLD